MPARYRGVWVRTLLETPHGRDDTTFVRWLQTGRWHADLRTPAGPARAPALQQGFCGVTEVDTRAAGERCQWHRQFDYQPPGLHPDAGWMAFESDHVAIETGIHGTYREVWQRLPESVGPSIVLAGPNDAGDGADERWLQAGDCLMRVRPRRVAWPAGTAPGDTLAQLIASHPAQATALFDFEISFGTLLDDVWTIERSTLPELDGRRLSCCLERRGVEQAAITLEGVTRPFGVLEWRLPDATR